MKRWWLVFVAVFLACEEEPPQLRAQQTIEVEMALNDSGDIISIVDRNRKDIIWATHLIRGTHRDNVGWLDNVPFIDSLFNDHYYRVIITEAGKDTVAPQGMNSREHQQQGGVLKAYDLVKVRIDASNIVQVKAKIQNTAIYDSLEMDEVEDVKKWERLDWGKKGSKEYFILLFDAFDVVKLDSIRNDSVRWNIDPFFFRDSVIVCGESFRNLTIGEVLICPEIPDKIKITLQAAVDRYAAITLQTTIWQIMKDHRGKLRNLWLRHPKFRKYAERWVKRKLQ